MALDMAKRKGRKIGLIYGIAREPMAQLSSENGYGAPLDKHKSDAGRDSPAHVSMCDNLGTFL
jgi:hypothetical protein